ncbi:MAG: c-type cytochrome [Planctomycetota bacterium]|jgi:cytochrome c553
MRALTWISTALVAAGLMGLALAGPDEAKSPAERGKALFHDNKELEYASCAMCHNLVPEAEERKKAEHLPPGGTLYGSAVREGWRNRKTYADVGEASQTCAKLWQKRKKGLKADQRADLVAFLKTVAPDGTLPMRKVQRTPKPLKKLEGGDAEKGRKLTELHCGGCHGKKVDDFSSELRPNRLRKPVVARKVRGYNAKSKFKPQDGMMSYFTNDRLPDEDLKHILAYLGR